MRRRRRRSAPAGSTQAAAPPEPQAPQPAAPDPRPRPYEPQAYDEGVQLLRAAVDQVRHPAAPVTPIDSPADVPGIGARRRRSGNGNGHGNGSGNGRGGNGRAGAATVPAPPTDATDQAEPDQAEADTSPTTDDETDLDHAPDHVAARRRWVARSRRRARAREVPPPPAEPTLAPVTPAEAVSPEDDEPIAPAPEPAPDAEPPAAESEPELVAVAIDAPAAPDEALPDEAPPDEAPPVEAAAVELDAAPELDADVEAAELEALAAEPAELEAAARPPLLAPLPPPGRAPRRRRERLIIGVAIVTVLAVTGILAALTLGDRGSGGDGGGSAAPTAAPVEFTFDRISLAPGATVERSWNLSGADGTRFEGTLEFANTTDERMAVSHTEVIPKSLAESVDDIEFDPSPVVIQADPVVRFDVDVPADGTATATYRIDVAPDGTDESRLEDWADDLETEEARHRQSTTTTTSTTTPTTTTTATTTTQPGSGNGGNGGRGGGGGGGTNRGPGGRPSGGNPAGNPAAAPAPPPPPPPAPPPPPPPAPPPPPPPATDGLIVVRAVSVGGNATFGFSGPGGNVQIATSGGPNGAGQWAAGVAAGTYSWTEVGIPPGWRLFNIDCSDRDAGPFELRSTVSGATATFNVQPGETIVCTWTNRPG